MRSCPFGRSQDAFTDDGALTDSDLRTALADLIDQLVLTASKEFGQLGA